MGFANVQAGQLSLSILLLLSKKKDVWEPKTQGFHEKFQCESCVSLGIGIIFIQDG